MLRSPDDRGAACYLRLTPEEWQLATLMDGTRTVARLVAEFARIGGRLAPDQVTRVVADLAANRMLDELPVDAFRPLAARAPPAVARPVRPRRCWRSRRAGAPWSPTSTRWSASSTGPAAGSSSTRPPSRCSRSSRVAGLRRCSAGPGGTARQSVFLTGGSYVVGAAVLLGLNVLALACHELGHALATKHAGRRVPAAGFLVYFGIPSVFVDTTDVWMAGRRARMTTTAAGPAAGLVLAGIAAAGRAVFVPAAAPWTFKLAFAWYLNALFNLNPFLALDGYYLLMDWLEIPNLRARGLTWVVSRLRRRPPRWSELDREGRLVALYGTLAVLWVAIAVNLGYRIWTDRVAGLTIGLWRSGWPARILLVAVDLRPRRAAGLPRVRLARRPVPRAAPRGSPSAAATSTPRAGSTRCAPPRSVGLSGAGAGRPGRGRPLGPPAHRPATRLRRRRADAPSTSWSTARVEGRRPDDPAGRSGTGVGAGGVVGLASALTGAPAALDWHTAGTTLLVTPAVRGRPGRSVRCPARRRPNGTEADRLFAEAPALSGAQRRGPDGPGLRRPARATSHRATRSR